MAAPLKKTAKSIFSGLYTSYDWVLDYFTLFQDSNWKRSLIAGASLSAKDLILDVGFGTGVLEQDLENWNVSIIGIDITREMVEIAKAKRISCLKAMLLGDAEKLPFATESYDRVVSCYAIKYCDIQSFVKESYRVLKPGGRLVLYDFARPHGFFGPIHGFYVYGILRFFGKLTRRFDIGMSFTLSELPGIISKTKWEEELGPSLSRHGFQDITRSYLSGGGATMFAASKPLQA